MGKKQANKKIVKKETKKVVKKTEETPVVERKLTCKEKLELLNKGFKEMK